MKPNETTIKPKQEYDVEGMAEQLGGGEKAMTAMLNVGVQAVKDRQRMALLGVESLLVAADDLNPLCVDILIREYRRLTEAVRGEAEDWKCCTSGNPVAELIARITDLLQDAAPGLLSGLLIGLHNMAGDDSSSSRTDSPVG